MKQTIFDVAKYILHKMGETVTWELHKLCYYSQAWYLVWEDESLFNEDFYAWRNGPVCDELYDAHKGMLSITEKSMSYGNINNLSDEQKGCIDIVLRDYGYMEPYELWDQIHTEEPWLDAYETNELIITKKNMKKYYGKLYDEAYGS